MKRDMEKVGAERKTVKELGSEDLRHVLGGQNIPSIRLTPPEGGDVTDSAFYVDPSGLYK